jgi:two-component system, cell cycle response regulator DivK
MTNKVLVVEDYEDARRLYKQMLEDLGFNVIEASDGYEAVEQFNEEHPNLILMDMALPGMDGVAATRHIKDVTETKPVPIIGITAHGNFYNDRAVEAGCDAIMTKPIDLNKLKSIISLYLNCPAEEGLQN